MAAPDPVSVIEATLSPIFLVSGASIFLNFLQTRLFRINDRLRAVAAADAADGDRRHLQQLLRRQRLVRNAIVLGVVTVLLTMLTAILLVAPVVAGVAVAAQVTVVVFALALAAFAGALLFALEDTFLSVRMVEVEARAG